MARTIAASESIAANTTVSQLARLQNQRFNPSAEPQAFAFYAKESAAGLEVDVSAGAEIHAENVEPAVGTGVSVRDDLIVNGVLLANSRLVIRTTNTTAGALTLHYRVVFEVV